MKKVLLLLFILLPCLLLAGCSLGNRDAYTITFSINGEKTKVEVPRGELPVCPSELLSWETSEHFYMVTGWDKEIVPAERNATYVATVGEYGLTVYEVLFIMPGGVVKVKTHEGETPTPPEGYETDLTRVDEIGTFAGWDKALTAPTAENTAGGKPMTYTPRYTYSTRYYNVTFKVGDTEYTIKVPGKVTPTVPKSALAALVPEDITLRFTGWDKEFAAVTEDTTYTAQFGNAATLMQAKDGAKGIFTMTYDDGLYNTATWVNEENKKYGLTGSCMMVPNWNKNEPNFTHNGGTIDKWNALFAEGTLEPQSHSTSHENTGILADETSSVYKDRQYNNYQENYQYELVQAVTEIKNAFPKYDPICFAPSNNTLSHKSYKSDGKGNLVKENGKYVLIDDGGATKVAEATYYAIRKGDRKTVQTLDPTPDGNAGGWYNLAIKAFKDYSITDEEKEGKTSSQIEQIKLQKEAIKVENGKRWLDDAARDGTWLIVMCHGISEGGGDIRTSSADQFFAYAGEIVGRGDLWPATFGDATKYIRERQNTTVSQRFINNMILVDMKINRTTSEGKFLDENVFNYPLTVEVRVPAEWKNVSYVNAGKSCTATVYTRDGASYAMVNLTPGANGQTVTTMLRQS